jgi:hypothetical protein
VEREEEEKRRGGEVWQTKGKPVLRLPWGGPWVRETKSRLDQGVGADAGTVPKRTALHRFFTRVGGRRWRRGQERRCRSMRSNLN